MTTEKKAGGDKTVVAPVTEAPAAEATSEETRLNARQVIESAQELFGRPAWAVEVAVRRFGDGDAETMTVASVEQALTKLDNLTVTAE
jgi:hypothetical protein